MRDAAGALEQRLDAGLKRARADRDSPALVSVTGRQPARDADPTAIVAASRRAGEPWFCLEQPDRDGSALAALGLRAVARGRRSGAVRDGRRALARAGGRLRSPTACDGPPGSGLVALGGFAFAPDGGQSPRWQRVRARVADRPRGLVRPPRGDVRG